MTRPTESTGVLVIRAWVEKDDDRDLRARLTGAIGLETREEAVATAAGIDEICAAVRAWLEELINDI